jgi:two-component system, LuxR family, response regulator FixJ
LPSSQIVHVIDDDADVRQSLSFLLSTAGLAVRVHESAVAFLKVLPGVEGGCIVTDVRMPSMDGIELQRRLQSQKNTIPVIVMTGHGDIALAVEAMKAGAADFIEKPFDDEALLGAIRAALGARGASPEESTARKEAEAKLADLSPRERDVLQGLVAGKINKVIAHDLSISPRTVEVYRANLMAKTGARSMSELMRIALAAGL